MAITPHFVLASFSNAQMLMSAEQRGKCKVAVKAAECCLGIYLLKSKKSTSGPNPSVCKAGRTHVVGIAAAPPLVAVPARRSRAGKWGDRIDQLCRVAAAMPYQQPCMITGGTV